MIPCFICKKDSVGGFSYGLPTTPESMYVGLCPEHNTLENKKAAILHWIESTQASVSAFTSTYSSRYPTPAEYEISVYYLAGGVVSVRAIKWNVKDGATLQLETVEEGATFIPLIHIERFEVVPVEDPNAFSSAENVTEVYSVTGGKPVLQT